MNVPILYAKLKVPEPRAHYLSRTHLYDRMDAIHTHKILLLQGGAGCGKTTLVSSYIKEQGIISSSRWLTLDESCNQIHIF